MNLYKFGVALVVALILASTAAADQPAAGVGQPAAVACMSVCYCCKPMPCVSCPPTDGISVCYCRKPMPCVSCPPTDGMSVCYCRKPWPNFCNLRPACCP